jgi:hypothetical protein
MDSVRDLLPLFQYRNLLVDDNDNDDNYNNNNEDDDNNNNEDDNNNSLQYDYLAQSIAEAIASRQGCNATSGVDGLHHSAGSDDRHVVQWETRIDAFQEHTHMSLDALIGQELVPSSLEQVNNNMIIRIMNAPDEPWNPLSSSRGSLVNTSAAVMCNTLYYIVTGLDAPSIYYTATSEIVTNEAFHSATSRLEGYRNTVLGTISV